MTNTVDVAPTWLRRYTIPATSGAMNCAVPMAVIGVSCGPGSPINPGSSINHVASAKAFGRVSSSFASAIFSGLVSARDRPATALANRFPRGAVRDAASHACSGSLGAREPPPFSGRRAVAGGKQIAPGRGVGAPFQWQHAIFEPIEMSMAPRSASLRNNQFP